MNFSCKMRIRVPASVAGLLPLVLSLFDFICLLLAPGQLSATAQNSTKRPLCILRFDPHLSRE